MEQLSDHIHEVSSCVAAMLNNYNTGITQEQFYSQNIVDSTDISEDYMREINSGVIQFCKENGCYAALPPFEEGSFIDRSERRYVTWKVLEVEDDYFRLELDHYPIVHVGDFEIDTVENMLEACRRCWHRAYKVIVKVKLITTQEHMDMLKYHPDFRYVSHEYRSPEVLKKLSDRLMSEYHVGGVLESYEDYRSNDLKKILKKGKYYTADGQMVNGMLVRKLVNDSLDPATDGGLSSVLFSSLGPIVEMFVCVNYLLSQQASGSSTLRHITSTYAPNPEATELRKERHFGALTVVSQKKPRSVTAQNIHRVYTAAVWQRRGHLRHLASGKVVPVKAAVCKRHGVEDAKAPQIIYKA